MNFIGENLFIGKLGHLLVIISWVASLIAAISFFKASSRAQDPEKGNWLALARGSFLVQVIGIISIFGLIFYICQQHLYEYLYAYKHASKELEFRYLLACIWEGQEGSFLLWAIWHALIGLFFMARYKKQEWQAPVMAVISVAQFFLLMMLLGIYISDIKIGSSPFYLTRNELDAPIFNRPDYLEFIKDGMGLNVLLRNYWMVIHPPVLFLGFASTLIPYAFAYAGIRNRKFGEWVKPAIPWALFAACVLGVGIMMGGKWAYESLSFGGYWAWDPVENASLVPWLILVAGLHTMAVYQSTGHSLRASYFFIIMSLVFILYSTFLTRTGVLGDTSVHSFTEAGKAINIMIGSFVLAFTLPMLFLFTKHYKQIPAIHKEEESSSREFWMFIGSLVFFLTAMFIIAKTSVPVYNKVFGTNIASPEDVEFSYNKVVVMVAIVVGLLTAITQYLKYKHTPGKYLLKKIAFPTLVASLITGALAIFYPVTYYSKGAGFLGAIYVALFASIYATVANAMYIWMVIKGNLKQAGASLTHAGFALMLVGMIISSGNKEVISSSLVNGITLPASGKDPMTKQTDNPLENLTLIRQVPTRMSNYEVTYLKDSAGHEKGRKFYKLQFDRKEKGSGSISESFVLQPDVYMMKDNNMSSNPDTKTYLNRDIFTYISYALKDKNVEDTSTFQVTEMQIGDTAFYGNGQFVLNNVVRNPRNQRFQYQEDDAALMADITFISRDSMRYHALPLVEVDSFGLRHVDDTVYAQNLFVRFTGISDNQKVKIGVRETDQMIDFVTVKAYVFPYIVLVWFGIILMAAGFIVSLIRRSGMSGWQGALLLAGVTIALLYMFLFAN